MVVQRDGRWRGKEVTMIGGGRGRGWFRQKSRGTRARGRRSRGNRAEGPINTEV